MPKITSKLGLWSAAVKERDGKCMECGRVEDLHAHHIKPKSTHPELKLDVENGKTLCYGCHKSEHEKNRPVRVRSEKPNRKTLLMIIKHLESKVATLEGLNDKLEKSNAAYRARLNEIGLYEMNKLNFDELRKKLVTAEGKLDACKRGSCEGALESLRKVNHGAYYDLSRNLV